MSRDDARMVADAPLTPREREIIAWVATGKSNREIAKALDVTVKTVKVHKTHAARKLQLGKGVPADRISARLTRYAIEEMGDPSPEDVANPPKRRKRARATATQRRTEFPLRFLMYDAKRCEDIGALIEGHKKGRRGKESFAGQRARALHQAIAAYADLDASYTALEAECASLREQIAQMNPYAIEEVAPPPHD